MASGVTLENHWGEMAAKIRRAAPEMSKQTAAKVLAFAQNIVPVDTGELLSSGHIEQDGDTYYVVFGTDHCWYVEFGTMYMAAQPYLTPAVESVHEEWMRFTVVIAILQV